MSKYEIANAGIKTHWVSPEGQRLNLTFTTKFLSGRPELTGVCISATTTGSLNQTLLREIPFKQLFDGLVRQRQPVKHDFEIAGNAVELKVNRRGAKHRAEDLELLAKAYEEVRAQRLPILPTLAARLGLSPSTINKRLIAARREGLLTSRRPRDGERNSSQIPRRKNGKSTVKRQRGSKTSRNWSNEDS